MNKIKILDLTLIVVTVTFADPAFSKQPNFLFLLSDDQAWNGLSCAMHPDFAGSESYVIETPNIARLAAEGMRFSAGYSPASVCSPTRISLQTGKSPAACHWTRAAPSLTAEDGFKLVPPVSRKAAFMEGIRRATRPFLSRCPTTLCITLRRAWQEATGAPRPSERNLAFDPSAPTKKGREQRGKKNGFESTGLGR